MHFPQRRWEINMTRLSKIILFYAIMITMFISYIFLYISPIQLKNGIYVNAPQAIAPFELIDHKGDAFTEMQLEGHWSLLFFGFSSCPMICPGTLETLKHVDENLPASTKIEIIFVSVDPEHDSVQHLNEYMRPFNKNFIAVTGQMSAINALQKQLHVPVSSAPSSHGTEIILINPQAQVQAYFNYPITSQALLYDLNNVFNSLE